MPPESGGEDAVKAGPDRDIIQEWNIQRDIEFQRLRLVIDPDSEASNDHHFNSAFAKEPVKVWNGEVGAVILGNTSIISSPAKEEDLRKVLYDYTEL